jgi:hypothetical protein
MEKFKIKIIIYISTLLIFIIIPFSVIFALGYYPIIKFNAGLVPENCTINNQSIITTNCTIKCCILWTNNPKCHGHGSQCDSYCSDGLLGISYLNNTANITVMTVYTLGGIYRLQNKMQEYPVGSTINCFNSETQPGRAYLVYQDESFYFYLSLAFAALLVVIIVIILILEFYCYRKRNAYTELQSDTN